MEHLSLQCPSSKYKEGLQLKQSFSPSPEQVTQLESHSIILICLLILIF